MGSPGDNTSFAAAVAWRAKHSTGVAGLLVSGLSSPMMRTFSSRPATRAWIVSPSTTRITVAGVPPGTSVAMGEAVPAAVEAGATARDAVGGGIVEAVAPGDAGGGAPPHPEEVIAAAR